MSRKSVRYVITMIEANGCTVYLTKDGRFSYDRARAEVMTDSTSRWMVESIERYRREVA